MSQIAANVSAYYEECDYDFEKGDEFSDLKLKIEGKTLHVHKAILRKSQLRKHFMANVY